MLLRCKDAGAARGVAHKGYRISSPFWRCFGAAQPARAQSDAWVRRCRRCCFRSQLVPCAPLPLHCSQGSAAGELLNRDHNAHDERVAAAACGGCMLLRVIAAVVASLAAAMHHHRHASDPLGGSHKAGLRVHASAWGRPPPCLPACRAAAAAAHTSFCSCRDFVARAPPPCALFSLGELCNSQCFPGPRHTVQPGRSAAAWLAL